MFRRALPAAALAFLACAAMNAQQAAPRPRTVWDGAYTDAQAERARGLYETTCARCHTLTPQPNAGAQAGGQGGSLSGEKFWVAFTQRTVGDLLAYTIKNMPNGNPGTLSPAQYNDLVALILKVNGFPPGPAEVTPAMVADIQIIPKDGPGELPSNVLVRIVGCLDRDGSDWILTQATVPERIDRTGAGPTDATRPLGTRSVALKFVLTRLNAFVGKRMSVSGLLIGSGGVGGINVSEISRVADTCQ